MEPVTERAGALSALDSRFTVEPVTERAGALSALDSRFTVERGWVTLLCQSQVYSKVTPLHARTHYSFSDSFPTLGVTGL